MSDEDKFQVIYEMLSHFKQQHNHSNQCLRDSGESKYCSPFETIQVEDIKNYMLQLKGLEKDFINM